MNLCGVEKVFHARNIFLLQHRASAQESTDMDRSEIPNASAILGQRLKDIKYDNNERPSAGGTFLTDVIFRITSGADTCRGVLWMLPVSRDTLPIRIPLKFSILIQLRTLNLM